jgi:hypothetical protein
LSESRLRSRERQARAEKTAAEAQDNLCRRGQAEDFSKEVNDDADIVTETIEKSEHLKKRNTIDIASLASTALRYEVSSRAAAACATAYLGCLIRAEHLPPEAVYLAVDPSKIQRARDQVLSEATFSGLQQLEEQTPECLLFDSRIDNTKERHFDEETQRFYARVEREDHYTVTDGDGAYLTHFTKPGKSLNDEDVKEDEAEDKELELEEEVDSRVYDNEDKPEEE